ncbi:MAG: CehA/McbA family metallohydrolase [Planctomycetaceae bacterium]|nr:CehA/McbA family metallohydrolase [Planctomycetaceae bacterium]
MPPVIDGPASSKFTPLPLAGNVALTDLKEPQATRCWVDAAPHAPSGKCVGWGVPFNVGPKAIVLREGAVTRKLRPLRARWLVFMHTSEIRDWPRDERGCPESPRRGPGYLNEHVANYVLVYADGTEASAEIRRRHQIGPMQRGWGENCFQAVALHKPQPVPANHEKPTHGWGWSQTRAASGDMGWWVNWLWAMENPHPEKKIVALRFESVSGMIAISAVTAGNVSSNPLAWGTRQKAVLTLPAGANWDSSLDDNGRLAQIALDMGQVISAAPRLEYPAGAAWARTYNNQMPAVNPREIVVEYAAHADAAFHLAGGKTIAAAALGKAAVRSPLRAIAPATQRVILRVVEQGGRKPVAAKLHVHGQAGEYLPPVDRHRIPNACWYEDWSVDFVHGGHLCSYIPGETTLNLPLGKVYIEVSKGFEIRPVRKVVTVTAATKEIVIPIERVLPWRQAGWVSADTHVHFLSPHSALLEGAGEGVNVVNLLASQWGELMTNVGDFDGKTLGEKATGGDGEHLVRVGTENRQHILGHISLLGYRPPIIAPMTTGGADEAAIGDGVECLLTEWARMCKRQGGVVIVPHFPAPRAEHAAAIVDGAVSGVEMTSWGNLYFGIDAYSLCDWYRYLNCGYFVAAVGGTDKMSANTAVGTVRTYAQIRRGQAFTYEAWKHAVRDGRTFVTFGPLVDFAVEGRPSGTRIAMKATGGTVDVTYRVASVTVPMTKVELIVNGEVRDSRRVDASGDIGHWSVKIDRSSWVALLVRAKYKDKPEMIAAHSSPVIVDVKGSEFFAAADAMTILEQIEGAMAYLDTVGPRHSVEAHRRMRLVLTGVHRKLHNRMHQHGEFHNHTPTADHQEHH